MNNLEKITNQGYKDSGKKYGEYKVFVFEKQRLFYDEVTDSIIIKYKKEDEDIKLCGNN